MSNTQPTSRRILLLLLTSILLLSSLIPGGPIENRDFSGLPPLTVLSFNVFLASLLLASVASTLFVWRGQSLGSLLSVMCGAGFFGVYFLDLWEIFPTSPTPMSTALYSVEAAGLIVSVLLVAASAVRLFQRDTMRDAGEQPSPRLRLSGPALLAILVLSGIIVAFATYSALSPQ